MMFGAAQCLGYRMERGKPSQEMCYQSEKIIARDVGKVIKDTGMLVFVVLLVLEFIYNFLIINI